MRVLFVFVATLFFNKGYTQSCEVKNNLYNDSTLKEFLSFANHYDTLIALVREAPPHEAIVYHVVSRKNGICQPYYFYDRIVGPARKTIKEQHPYEVKWQDERADSIYNEVTKSQLMTMTQKDLHVKWDSSYYDSSLGFTRYASTEITDGERYIFIVGINKHYNFLELPNPARLIEWSDGNLFVKRFADYVDLFMKRWYE